MEWIFCIFSRERVKPKICVNCKYIIPDTIYSWQTPRDTKFSEYSRCSLFPQYSNNKNNHLVTGNIEKSTTIYHYCSTARDQDSMCGEEGKEYKKKYTKKTDKNPDKED